MTSLKYGRYVAFLGLLTASTGLLSFAPPRLRERRAGTKGWRAQWINSWPGGAR